MGQTAQLPVSQETLERLEARRQKWGHEDFELTIRTMLDAFDMAEDTAGSGQADGAQG